MTNELYTARTRSVPGSAHDRRWPWRLSLLPFVSLMLFSLGALVPAPGHAQEIIEFETSDSQRQDQLNGFMELLLDPTQNPSGQTAINTGDGMPWFDNVSRLRLILGAQGTTPLQFSVFAALRDVRLNDNGYSWLSFTGHGWPFPRWDQSEGLIPGWEFNGGTTQGWSAANVTGGTVSNGIWSFQTNHNAPRLTSPTTNFDASLCPLVRIHIGCNTAGSTCDPPHFFQLFWKTQTSPTFSEDKSIVANYLPEDALPPFVPNDSILEYAIFAGNHPAWTGTVTALRLDPTNVAEPTSFEIDKIVCAFDTRRTDTNPNFITSLLNYHRATANTGIFTSPSTFHGTLMDKAREIFQFMWDDLGGGVNDCIRVEWPGHDGLRGLNPNNTPNVGHAIGETINDIWPYGWDSAPATLAFYKSVLAMSELEARAAELGVSPNPYGHTAASLETKAAAVASEFTSRFWSTAMGRLRSSIDKNGVPHDIGDVSVNLDAVTSGILGPSETQSIMTWLDDQRVVSGDTSQGSDIYHWVFAPRSNTKDAEPESYFVWVVYIWWGPNLNGGGNYNDAVNNGGGWLRNTHDDIVARSLVLGPDNAWDRMTAVLDWYEAAMNAGGFRAYYDALNIEMQGCGTGGSVLVDCEGAVEGALAPVAFLDAFVGLTHQGQNGLRVAPRIPSQLDYVGIRRFFYKDHFYDVRASRAVAGVVRYVATHPDTGIPQYPNSAHNLQVEFTELSPNTMYTLRVHDLDAGTSADSSVGTNAAGELVFNFQMPANGRVEVIEPPPIPGTVIFEDDFEAGDFGGWSCTTPGNPPCSS